MEWGEFKGGSEGEREGVEERWRERGRGKGREGRKFVPIGVALYDAIICLSIRNYVHNNQGCVRSSLAFNLGFTPGCAIAQAQIIGLFVPYDLFLCLVQSSLSVCLSVCLSCLLQSSPEFSQQPTSQVAIADTAISFSCSVLSSPEPSTFTWEAPVIAEGGTFNIQDMDPEQNSDLEVGGVISTSVLHIPNVEGQDSGLVRCLANTGV